VTAAIANNAAIPVLNFVMPIPCGGPITYHALASSGAAMIREVLYFYREFKNATSWRFCSSVRFIEKRWL